MYDLMVSLFLFNIRNQEHASTRSGSNRREDGERGERNRFFPACSLPVIDTSAPAKINNQTLDTDRSKV
jgi:hypothetical protein